MILIFELFLVWYALGLVGSTMAMSGIKGMSWKKNMNVGLMMALLGPINFAFGFYFWVDSD